MSKIKKKTEERSTTTISKKDIAFEKSIRFCAWFFLISLSVFLAYYGIFDVLLERIDLEITAVLFSYAIFTGTSSALCFALSTKISRNRDRKSEIFIDWIIAEFLLCMFAIFSVAVYQW
ncbi:MAG: hypothetical protein ACFFHV_03840 [Promethearchaeota archaeon]